MSITEVAVAVVLGLVYVTIILAIIRKWPLGRAIVEAPQILIDDLKRWSYRTALSTEQRRYERTLVAATSDGERRVLMLVHLRRSLAALGCDVSDLTDDEIEAGTVAVVEAMADAGLSGVEAGRALNAVMKVAYPPPPNPEES